MESWPIVPLFYISAAAKITYDIMMESAWKCDISADSFIENDGANIIWYKNYVYIDESKELTDFATIDNKNFIIRYRSNGPQTCYINRITMSIQPLGLKLRPFATYAYNNCVRVLRDRGATIAVFESAGHVIFIGNCRYFLKSGGGAVVIIGDNLKILHYPRGHCFLNAGANTYYSFDNITCPTYVFMLGYAYLATPRQLCKIEGVDLVCLDTGQVAEKIKIDTPRIVWANKIDSIKFVQPDILIINTNDKMYYYQLPSGNINEIAIDGPFIRIDGVQFVMVGRAIYLYPDFADCIYNFSPSIFAMDPQKYRIVDYIGEPGDIMICSTHNCVFAINKKTNEIHEVHKINPALRTKPALR